MNCIKSGILTLIAVVGLSSCDREESFEPISQNSYINILQGKGSDAPLSIQELNGGLLIVSNTTIVERGQTSNEVRLFNAGLNGVEITNSSRQYFPRNLDENWIASEVLVINNDRIIIAGTVGEEDTSMFFLEVNAQLDSIQTQYYQSEAEQYSLTGLSYDEGTSTIYFSGSEWSNGGEEYTLFGQMKGDDLSLDQAYRTEKARALPATAILQNSSGGLIWAYNSGNSVLARSSSKDMRQLDDAIDLEFQNVINSSIETKSLFLSASEEIILFGELQREGQNQIREMFFYNASVPNSEAIAFGENGQNQMNGVKQIEDGYLIAGSTSISEEGAGTQTDFFLAFRGLNGSHRFVRSFGSTADETLHDAIMVNNNIYSIGSTTLGIDNVLLLIKTNKSGELVN